MTEFSNEDAISVPNLKRRIEHGWGELQHFLGTLTDEQFTTPTDANGWTIKDHMVHLAAWEEGLRGVVAGKSKRETMEIDEATWEQGDDPINAVIQQRYRDLSLEEAKAMSQRVHESLVARLYALTDDDLTRPYAPDATHPLIALIMGDTSGHYLEHIPWMQAIVENT